MKQLYTIAFILSIGFTAQAQLTQQNHAPAAGDTYTMIGVDPTGINPGAAGSNVTWNFASAATINTLVMNYTTAAATNSLFPAADVVTGYSSSNMSYYSSSSSSLSYYGGDIDVSSVTASLKYAQPAIAASYPMNLNTSATAPISGTINSSIANGTFVGTSSVTLDGQGTLILSTGTFSNVMRTRTTQTFDFSSTFLNGKLWQDTYDYYSPGTKAPLFTIVSATVNLGQDFTETMASRNIAAVPTVTSSVGSITSEPFSLFPNPASAEVQIKGVPAGAALFVVYDLAGKKMMERKVDGAQMTINITGLAKGLYSYTLLNSEQGELASGRFTVAD